MIGRYILRFSPLQFTLNPVLVKELRTYMRGTRPYTILTFFLLTLVGVGFGIYQLVVSQERFGMSLISPQVGQAMFSGLAMWQLFLIVFLVPALTSGAISSERERLTYDMLVTTPLQPIHILWGKLLATLSYVFILILASLPVFSVVLMFGGVTPNSMAKALALLLITAITYGTIGLFCSALFKRTSQATVVSYTLILMIVGVTLLIASVWGRSIMQPDTFLPPQVVYLNPFSALASIVAIAPSGMQHGPSFFSSIGSPFGDLPLLDMLAPGVVHYGGEGIQIIPVYRATLLFYPLIAALVCWISSHLVLPRQRWYPRWSDISFSLLLFGMLVLVWLLRDWWFIVPETTHFGAPGPVPMPVPKPFIP